MLLFVRFLVDCLRRACEPPRAGEATVTEKWHIPRWYRKAAMEDPSQSVVGCVLSVCTLATRCCHGRPETVCKQESVAQFIV